MFNTKNIKKKIRKVEATPYSNYPDFDLVNIFDKEPVKKSTVRQLLKGVSKGADPKTTKDIFNKQVDYEASQWSVKRAKCEQKYIKQTLDEESRRYAEYEMLRKEIEKVDKDITALECDCVRVSDYLKHSPLFFGRLRNGESTANQDITARVKAGDAECEMKGPLLSKSFLSFILFFLALISDAFCFYTILSTNPSEYGLHDFSIFPIIIGLLAAFDGAPLYLGYAISLKLHGFSGSEVYSKLNSNVKPKCTIVNFLIIFSIVTFILGFTINVLFRLSQWNNTDVTNILGYHFITSGFILIPVVTSLLSLISGLLSFDPLLSDLHKLQKRLNLQKQYRDTLNRKIASFEAPPPEYMCNDNDVKDDNNNNNDNNKEEHNDVSSKYKSLRFQNFNNINPEKQIEIWVEYHKEIFSLRVDNAANKAEERKKGKNQ